MTIHSNVSIIAAVGKHGQIGLNGKLPWHDKEDLQWFKRTTRDAVLVVGYNTAQKLPPLPGRVLHVLQRGDTPESIMDEYSPNTQFFVIGGAKTYEQWMPYAKWRYISQIDYDGEADTYMPQLWNTVDWDSTNHDHLRYLPTEGLLNAQPSIKTN